MPTETQNDSASRVTDMGAIQAALDDAIGDELDAPSQETSGGGAESVETSGGDRARDERGRFAAAKPESDAEAGGESDDDEGTGASDADKPEQPSEPQLPRHLVAAAKFAGLSDEDIAEDLKTLGVERATRQYEKWRGGQRTISERLMAIGQRANAAQSAAPSQQANGAVPGFPSQQIYQQPQQFQPQPPASPKLPTKEQFDERYGDGAYDDMIAPMQQMLQAQAQQNQMLYQQLAMQAQRQQQPEVDSGAIMADFFEALPAEERAAYLNGQYRRPTAEQSAKLRELATRADMILAGAEATGQQMKPEQALALAHDMLSAPEKREIASRRSPEAIEKRRDLETARGVSRGNAKPMSREQRAIAALHEADRTIGGEPFFGRR